MAVTILSDAEKQELVTQFNRGSSKTELAKRFKVSTRTVGRVIAELGDPTPTPTESESEVPSYKVTGSSKAITVVRENDGKTFSIDSRNARFPACIAHLKDSGLSNEALHELAEMIDLPTYVETVFKGNITIDPSKNTAYVGHGNTMLELPKGLTTSLCNSALSGDDSVLDKLIMFTNMLVNNPNAEIISELFDFLEASDIKIDSDGRVICWKLVRDDYMDVYSGTFLNKPGCVCEVPRVKVDPDRQRTCSYGLHVCSRAYLSHYSGSRVIKVAVKPSDFISIPNDYYSIDGHGEVAAKARVCRYEVLEDVTAEMRQYM